MFAGNDRHVPFGHAKRFRDQLDQLVIRRALNGRRLKTD
jgi:hypothetical protein